MKYITSLHIDFELVRVFNYHTNGYYGFLSEFDIDNYKDYEIVKSTIKDNFLEIYIQEIEI